MAMEDPGREAASEADFHFPSPAVAESPPVAGGAHGGAVAPERVSGSLPVSVCENIPEHSPGVGSNDCLALGA